MCGVPVHAAEGYLLDADPQGLPGRGLRADGGPGRGAEARGEVGGPPRGGAAGHAGDADRGQPAGGAAAQLPRRLRRGARRWRLRLGRRVHGRSDGHDVPAGRTGTDARAARRRARCWSPTRSSPSCASIVAEAGAVATPLARASFDSSAAEARVAAALGAREIDGFGSFGRAELGALGAIVDYLELTQRGRLPLLRPPVRERAGGLDGDRRGDAAKPRADPQLGRRARGVAAGDDRPDGDRRRRAAAGDAADRAVDRRGPDPGAGRRGGGLQRGSDALRRGARAAAPGARPRAGAVAAGARPRRAARPRGGARCAGAGRAVACGAAGGAAGGADGGTGGAGGAGGAARAARRRPGRRAAASRARRRLRGAGP